MALLLMCTGGIGGYLTIPFTATTWILRNLPLRTEESAPFLLLARPSMVFSVSPPQLTHARKVADSETVFLSHSFYRVLFQKKMLKQQPTVLKF